LIPAELSIITNLGKVGGRLLFTSDKKYWTGYYILFYDLGHIV
jgi:hypothetical protein